MKKKIIYDASILVSGKVSGNIHKTGLYRVSYEILKELEKSNEFELYLFDIFHRERELIKYVQKEFSQCNRIKVYSFWYRLLIFPLGNLADFLRKSQNSNNIKILSLIAGIFKNILLLIEKTARKAERMCFIEKNLTYSFNECNVYYSTYYPIPEQVRMNPKIEKVYTVHDLIPVLHPEYFASRYNQILVKEVIDHIEGSDYIVTFSESTKRDLLFYRTDLNIEKIAVSPLAASANFHQFIGEKERIFIQGKYNIPVAKEYILSVCTLEPRKNLKTLLAAYKYLITDQKVENIVLVLTGSPGWANDSLIQEISKLNAQFNNAVILTGFIPDSDLAALYSGAYMFVYPSLYEGFGLPPLEAMQCGVPVIASNTSSLPEVVGDSGILVNPENEKEFIIAISKLLNDKNLRRALSQKAISRAANFNWVTTTTIIKKVFDLALSGK